MNVVILGRGFIGTRLYNYLNSSSHIDKVCALSKNVVDYTDRVVLSSYLKLNPGTDVIINASGYTGSPNVDACESDKTACWNLNVIMPVMIESVCKQNNIQFIHISSGCIYNGYDRRWSEDDPSNFGLQNKSSSWYSKTKHAAETLLDHSETTVLRIRIPFTKDNTPKNYLIKLLHYDNLISYLNSVTCVEDFIVFVSTLLSKDIPAGIYNVVHDTPVSGKEVISILREFNINNPVWKFVDINNLDIVANRSNCILSTDKITSLDMNLPNVYDALRQSASLLSKQIEWETY